MPELSQFSEDEILELISSVEADWQPRWDRVKEWRQTRHKRDDVLSTVPPDMRVTDFEFHDSTLDNSCTDFANFMAAADPVFVVSPAKAQDRTKVDNIEEVLEEVMGPGGLLDRESNGSVDISVWQSLGDSGQGIFKLILKRDYPLRLPRPRYKDELDDDEQDDFEDNPDYNPRSRKAGREESKATRYREKDSAVERRQQEMLEDEFPFQWMYVDSETYFEVRQDERLLYAGELNARPATVLKDHDLTELMTDKGFVYLGESSPRNRASGGDHVHMVNTFELWGANHACFGFISNVRTNGKRRIVLSRVEKLARWKHPHRRPPYYMAVGNVKRSEPLEYRWEGPFPGLISETPLLNNLETIHYNAIFRGYFPFYQLIRDPGFAGEVPPMNAETVQIRMASDETQLPEAPTGYRWDLMPSGVEPSLTEQLEAARARVADNALASVLRGVSTGAGDSGAKVSLLINAAKRSIDPFSRSRANQIAEAAQNMLDVSKRLGLDLVVMPRSADDGVVKPLMVKSEDIVSTHVKVSLRIELPVDQAANETRAAQLKATGLKSYETFAPELLDVGDPVREKEKMAVERREPQIDQVAWLSAARRFGEVEPALFEEFMGTLDPEPPQDERTVGGGPAGAYGGGAAAMGQGRAALSGGQVDGNGTR